ncbi:MAG: manganese efflux pump [Acutalibacteraceae bacterium]
MPFIGCIHRKIGEQLIHTVDHWIALILLCYLGIKMIWDSRKKTKPLSAKKHPKTKTLLAMAVATSIDALATGVILPSAVGAETLIQMICSISAISVITFILCLIGVFLGKKFGCLLHNKSGILGGIVLICIGIKIFVEQMFF